MPRTDVGYYGIGSDHPAYRLTTIWGDRLERLTANDKLGIIATLSLWLSIDDDNDQHWDIPAIANTHLFPESTDFIRAIQVIKDIDSDGALALMSALLEQLRERIYAE